MKVLFIGGTGNISTAVSKLAVERGIELFLLNRGKTAVTIPGATTIRGDISNAKEISSVLKDREWDVVVDWISFVEENVQRDYELFKGKTKQYIFISSASVYQKPPSSPVITELTPLANPFWQYSRNKIACEERLMSYYRQEGFPVTIVRPSHTYSIVIPVPFGGGTEYTAVDRIKKGQRVIVHGDGTSLWTLTHADDFAKGFVGLLGHRQAVGQAFHITGDEVLTWNQILHAIGDAVGREVKIVHIASETLALFNEDLRGNFIGDKANCAIFDNTKIKKIVPGYVATIPFSQGIKKTIAWFEADPARQIIKKETNDWMDMVIERYEANLPKVS